VAVVLLVLPFAVVAAAQAIGSVAALEASQVLTV
jgi:hypothetical protein